MSKFKLITYSKAKSEIDVLKNYVDLIDEYEVNNVKQFVIKYYAITNSSAAVIQAYNNSNYQFECNSISHNFIMEVIKGPADDELHKILRSAFKSRYNNKK